MPATATYRPVRDDEQVREELCRSTARSAVQRFAGAHGDLAVPVPIDAIARWLGFQVVLLFTAGDEFSGLVSPPQRLIGINGHHHRHRRRFSLAHEISHILMKHPPESHCTVREIARYNIEADVCASGILIPDLLLEPLQKSTRTAAALARAFDVSEEAMVRKLKRISEAGAE
jgi:hypothetical protein